MWLGMRIPSVYYLSFFLPGNSIKTKGLGVETKNEKEVLGSREEDLQIINKYVLCKISCNDFSY